MQKLEACIRWYLKVISMSSMLLELLHANRQADAGTPAVISVVGVLLHTVSTMFAL